MKQKTNSVKSKANKEQEADPELLQTAMNLEQQNKMANQKINEMLREIEGAATPADVERLETRIKYRTKVVATQEKELSELREELQALADQTNQLETLASELHELPVVNNEQVNTLKQNILDEIWRLIGRDAKNELINLQKSNTRLEEELADAQSQIEELEASIADDGFESGQFVSLETENQQAKEELMRIISQIEY